MKPVLAFTMGDPAGIGPEVAIAAAKDRRVLKSCTPLLVGARSAFAHYGWSPRIAPLVDPGVPSPIVPGRPTVAGGRASFAAVRLALHLARKGLVRGLVTAPIAKASWDRAGIPFRDHTDFIKEATRSRRAAMMLMNSDLRAVLVTRHIPLKYVSYQLKEANVIEAARLAEQGLAALGIKHPRLGLCSLNPHSGESGILGSEEKRILIPALRRLRRAGMKIAGPLPADSAWAAHRQSQFDGLVSLYHDQTLIPLKMAARFGVVNWTLGVPIVRTSPGHGTAFDIAGRRRADPAATIEAAVLASNLSKRGVSWKN